MKYTLQVDFNLTKPFIVSLFIKLAQWRCIMSQVYTERGVLPHISLFSALSTLDTLKMLLAL